MSNLALNLLLVEDDELFRLGLRVRLQQETDIETILEAEDGETAILLASQKPFDLVLLDIGLPGIGGLETCRQFKISYPELPILILTSRDDPELVTRFIRAGAQGYCLKGIAAEKLILAVRSVVSGASWWDAIATQKIRQTVTASANSLPNSSTQVAASSQNPLTQREREVLALIAKAKSNLEIAQILYISAGTVRVHVHSILHKLSVGDRTQAVRLAQQLDWLARSEY
ncbi:MAG: response regulator transcription factor [Synechococcales cyanobacterium CRU_2_2]|nr:response regulator transcription factor [Synechococcales cyanobacterium CRU_2_2]